MYEGRELKWCREITTDKPVNSSSVQVELFEARLALILGIPLRVPRVTNINFLLTSSIEKVGRIKKIRIT